MVQSKSVRELYLYEPSLWALLVGLLDHGFVQCDFATGFLVQEDAYFAILDGCRVYLCEHRDVVRAVCYYGHVAQPGFPSEFLGLF